MTTIQTQTDTNQGTARAVSWRSSLRNQLGVALFSFVLLFTGTVAYTLYAMELRKHDYAILNLAGQLRVTAQAMNSLARNFLEAVSDLEVGNVSYSQFSKDLEVHLSTFGKIITAFEERNLPAELTGQDEPLKCHWDEQSINQLNATAGIWKTFQQGLEGVAGNPALVKTAVRGVHAEGIKNVAELRAEARYLVTKGPELEIGALALTKAFQRMMEGKLRNLKLFNQVAIGVSLLLLLSILILLQRKILGPVRHTLAGFARVSQGDLGHQVAVTADNEIGRMTESFNHLSKRLHALFRLTDRINHGTNLSDTLGFLYEEFYSFLPLDWVGILSTSPDQRGTVLERFYSPLTHTFVEGETFHESLGDFLQAATPLLIPNLNAYIQENIQENSHAVFARRLVSEGMGAAVYLPLAKTPEGGMVLVFAAQAPGAYTSKHLEWLGNIAGQVTRSLERTVVMEDLVVSAVAGMAKLAESRDPETGDHLVRMSLYSLILAEELARDSRFGGQLSSNVIRDIYRFAPMHDIGKVGIKDEILLKPGRLTPEERAEMETHPTIGGQVLRRCEAQMNAHGHSVFNVGIEIAECHHEKYDGSGYPNKLTGDQIPLSARIVAVADVFDALTSKRPYKDAWSVERALETLRADAGGHFDPDVVAAVEQALPRMLEVYERLKHV